MNMNSPDYANMETQDPTGMFPDLRALRRKEEEEMQQHNNYDARDVVLSQYMNLTRVLPPAQAILGWWRRLHGPE